MWRACATETQGTAEFLLHRIASSFSLLEITLSVGLMRLDQQFVTGLLVDYGLKLEHNMDFL